MYISKKALWFYVLIIGCVITIIIIGFSRRTKLYKETLPLMGTMVTVTLEVSSEKYAGMLFKSVFKEALQLERLLSRRLQGSDVSSINEYAGNEWVTVTSQTMNLILFAREIYRETEGAFDITVLPLIEIWTQAGKTHTVPSKEEIEKALQVIGSEKIEIDKEEKRIRFKQKGMGIDLGALAKGYIVDRMGEILKKEGCKIFIIDAGGDLLVSGTSGEKEWRIGIQNPRVKNRLTGTVNITNMALATSGDYERYFMQNGKRYHHIIDPRTGYPVTGVISVTVIAPNTVGADAYATAFFVMGMDQTRKYLEKKNDLEAIIITEYNGELIVNKFLNDTEFKELE